MAHSADRRLLAGALLLAVPLVAGCDSTFQENARAKLAASRRLAAKESQTVSERGGAVRVDRVTLLRDGASTAVVVDAHNTSSTTETDVPISVGVRRGSKKLLLNGAEELGWFQTHIPSVPARGKVTWVFRSPPGGLARKGDTPFVRIGAGKPLNSAVSALPSIRAAIEGKVGRTATVDLTEATLPQRDVPVNVVVRRGLVPVAAGTISADSVDRGERVTVAVPLTGRAGSHPATAAAAPTIFQ